jgi:ATP synthase protein I
VGGVSAALGIGDGGDGRNRVTSSGARRRLRSPLAVVIGLQAGIAVLVTVLFWGLAGSAAAESAFLGGAIGVVPSALYALLVARRRFGTPKDLLRTHVAGEAGKLALMLVFFAVVLGHFNWVAPLPLLLTFIATLFSHWFALLIVS